MNAEKFHCTSSPMDEHKTENLWSECFQDLGSWCRQPQDELNTPNANIQNEFNFSFDDQSMYYSLDANSSSLEYKSDMWKPQSEAELLPLQLLSEEDNKNSLMPMQTVADKNSQEAGIRYSGNLVVTQYPYNNLEQFMDVHQDNIEPSTWPETQKFELEPCLEITKPQNNILDKKTINVKSKTSRGEVTINKSKPSLKLNISAASKASTSVEIAAAFPTMSTPDVFKSLSEDSAFNILSYVEEGFDDPNFLGVDPSSIISQKPKETPKVTQQIIKIEHDYAETLPPENSNLTLLNVKSEDEEVHIKQEKDNYVLPGTMKEESHRSATGSGGKFGKRIRKSTLTLSDDYIFDEDPPSDHSSDWSPVVKKKCRAVKKKSGGLSNRGRTSSISDSGSVTSGPDRYRELRDRNNEASRRSRMNRKQKENEMVEHANILLRDNVKLKARSAALEKRVKALRDILLKVVLEKNK